MKTAVFVALLALAAAAPRPDKPESAELLHDEREQEGASYSTNVEIDNGILIAESGDDEGVQGTYVFTAPNGETVEMRLVANENGAVYESPSGHLPVAPLPVQAIHPIPEHALEAIEFASQQRAAGVEWDQQGFVIDN
ncbi:unnamed protein product [Meganyctiphanes norvegica]|uniref:Cuticle protein n=1 Tax=Meganyctiphanes norvegica TaxID=48144 RepID=A0AAV2S4F4_MEGNR